METSLSLWTDDLPVCRQSGIGIATNEIYKKDGRRNEMHPPEDRSFHFRVEEFGLKVYGVFDGFSGSTVSDFVSKKFPAELCLGQVSRMSTDEAIREALRQSFYCLDTEYFNAIGDKLALRMAKRLENPQDPHLIQLDMETIVGACATISVLLDDKKLFVANAGDVRVVICAATEDGDVRALPLSIDHLVTNEDEALRLSQLGLNVAKVSKVTEITRCLGFHQGKGGFKEIDFLKEAHDEPILWRPEIHGPFQIEPQHLFMITFTSPLIKCLEQIASSSDGDINTELCRITKEQFSENTTVSGVAQSVVDKIVRMHRDHFETEIDDNVERSWRREDITLLVRNFNAKLANGKRKTGSGSGGNNNNDTVKPIIPIPAAAPTRSSTTTESSADTFVKQSRDRELSVDENGRIKPYVDFSHFHQQWQKHQQMLQQNDL